MIPNLSQVSFFLIAILFLATRTIANPAESVYSQYNESIVQIRIIEVNADSQSALGTGFFVDDGNLLATNYHVVSGEAMNPEKYKIEIEFQGAKHNLELLFVDVISDLAILRSPVQGVPLKLADTPPEKGNVLYAIGNPLDLGMTLVEGNYNGLVEDRFFDQIHFSGAINSGMSGGPTLSEAGEVMGINVASAGNQVGFLVPVKFLHRLLKRALEEESDMSKLDEDIRQQIDRGTTYIIDQLLASEWPKDTIGDAIAIGQVVDAVECWGTSDKDEETRSNTISKGCKNRESIFLDHAFFSGYVEYEFHYYSVEDWPVASLYRYLSRDAGNARPGNRASKDYVGNFSCQEDIVNADEDNLKAKVIYCVRPYRRFKGLFDTLYMAISIDRKDKAIVSHFTLSGVSQINADRFLNKFIHELNWQ